MDGGFLPETAATRAAEFRRGPDAWATDPLPPSAALLAVAEAGPEVPPDSGCSRCTSLSYNQEYYKAFGVLLCNSCKRDEKLVSKVGGSPGRAGCSPRLGPSRAALDSCACYWCVVGVEVLAGGVHRGKRCAW